MSTVAVTGATGFVGRWTVRELLSRGHTVRALARDKAKAAKTLPRSDRLTIVVGDALDTAAVDELIRPAHACINAIGILREVRRLGQTFPRLHVDAVRVALGACERAGVRRFVQLSALGVRDVGISEYQTSKFEGETAVRKSGLDWTIFRPSLIHGPDAEFVVMAKGWLTGHKPPYFFLPYFNRSELNPLTQGMNDVDPRIQPVAVQDVASAMAACLANPLSVGEIYNLVGPEVLTWPQLLTFMRDNTPGSMPHLQPFAQPSEPLALLATLGGAVGLGEFLPFDPGMARMGVEDSVADMTKAREDLSFAPRPFRSTYAAYASSIA